MPAILALIGIAIVVFLYYLLIRWLFVSVGPGFIYVTALLFSIAVPAVYIRTLLRTFGRDGSSLSTARNWLFVCVVALVTLIHVDLLWLSLGIGMSFLRASFA